MKSRLYPVVSGVVFSIVCILQTLRAMNGWDVTLNGHLLPVWPSWFAAVATGGLALWAFTVRPAE